MRRMLAVAACSLLAISCGGEIDPTQQRSGALSDGACDSQSPSPDCMCGTPDADPLCPPPTNGVCDGPHPSPDCMCGTPDADPLCPPPTNGACDGPYPSADCHCGTADADPLCPDVCGQNDDKKYVCHLPPGRPGHLRQICVAFSAVPAHLAHGDRFGPCP